TLARCLTMLSPTSFPNVDGEREMALGLHAGVLVRAGLVRPRSSLVGSPRPLRSSFPAAGTVVSSVGRRRSRRQKMWPVAFSCLLIMANHLNFHRRVQ